MRTAIVIEVNEEDDSDTIDFDGSTVVLVVQMLKTPSEATIVLPMSLISRIVAQQALRDEAVRKAKDKS